MVKNWYLPIHGIVKGYEPGARAERERGSREKGTEGTNTTWPCSGLTWRDCGRCALRRLTLASQPRRRGHDSLTRAPVLFSWPDWAPLLPARPAPYHRRSEMGSLGRFRSSKMPVLVTLSCMNTTGGPTRRSPGSWSQQAQRARESPEKGHEIWCDPHHKHILTV